MTGLLNPMPGHVVSQPFAGVFYKESKAWLFMSGGKPWYAKPFKFKGGLYRPKCHTGVDVLCPVGTPILAPERMKIVSAQTDPVTGDHYILGEVRKETLLEFSHTSKILVPTGTIVDRGEDFALSGATGHVSGPHLHWGVFHTTAKNPNYHTAFQTWARHDPLRCLEDHDKAGRPWLVPVY